MITAAYLQNKAQTLIKIEKLKDEKRELEEEQARQSEYGGCPQMLRDLKRAIRHTQVKIDNLEKEIHDSTPQTEL